MTEFEQGPPREEENVVVTAEGERIPAEERANGEARAAGCVVNTCNPNNPGNDYLASMNDGDEYYGHQRQGTDCVYVKLRCENGNLVAI